jgi:translocation and assembly module TamB
VAALGAFAGIDPGVAADRPAAKGSASGTLEVTATIAGVSRGVTAGNVEGTARVALEPSTIGQIDIERANLDADYGNRVGQIRQLEIVGRDLNVHAAGRLAVDESGQSDLTVHADSARLETIGQLVGRPIAGSASLDGTVSGNRTELTVRGTLIGSGVKYGNSGALSIATRYDAAIPDLSVTNARVSAESSGAFVSIAGQNINDVTARTTYAPGQLDFDVTATQPDRSAQIAGMLTPHPSHQEVHLQRLALDSQGVRWELAPQSDATIQYGDGTVAVTGANLVNGTQRIAVDGVLGPDAEGLRIALDDIDLATFDAILLRPPQLAGRLDASATVTGTLAAPSVDAEFQVTQGGFREFKYDALTGTLASRDGGADLDARLQQSPSQWITAKGRVPLSLVRASDRPSATADGINLAVDSSRIDLGLIQGFTTSVAEVTGTLEAHVHIGGTVDDPQPSGTIVIQDGAMTVVPSGVRYTNIAGQLNLERDRLRTDLITILDNEQNALTLTGALAVNARRVGEVELYINADDFKFFDNELGNLRAEAAIEVTGDLKAPRLEGYFGVNTGRIELDEVLALAGPSAYPTEGIGGADERGQPGEERGLFQSVAMNVHVIVPNDLLVRASELQPGTSPISVGALNVTLGGDLRAVKEPGGPVRLSGDVNTVRGTYDFQGRRLEILRDGTVRFVGLEELNPTLNLRARREIRGVDVRVDIRGTLKAPEIVLSSTPPLDQADILALVVFNQPLNELGVDQQVSLAQRAQAMASGVIASQLGESIGDVLGLDTFEIDLAPESGGGPSVTFGEQIGGNVFLRVEQGIGDADNTNFILEYELTDWMRLQTNVIQGAETQQSMFRRAQSTGTDLILFFSF